MTNDSSDVYQDQFKRVACDGTGTIQPTLILIGTRLGIDRVTPVYWDSLREMLRFPQSVGIAGYASQPRQTVLNIQEPNKKLTSRDRGRPSASHYFVGVQGSHFFYLDPHTTRSALPYRPSGKSYTGEEIDTCHTRRLRRIHIKDMDPSMLIGFLIKDETDWNDWQARATSRQGKPIIHIAASETQLYPQGREEALDEVEALDED